MLFSFADQTLDVDRRELRGGSGLVPVEPQVFDVLIFLIRNRDRVVSKDDLIASVWGGRVVSEFNADQPHQCGKKSGRRQRGRATADPHRFPQGLPLRGQGRGERGGAASGQNLGCIGPERSPAGLAWHRRQDPDRRCRAGRGDLSAPSLHRGNAFRGSVRGLSVRGGAADALAHDVITRLAKLRSLFVIAQGTGLRAPRARHRP